MIRGKIFDRFEKLEGEGITILDQLDKLEYLDNEKLKLCGGASFINNKYYYNYEGHKNIMIYDKNTFKLILPPAARISDITRTLELIKGYGLDYKIYNILGYWINEKRIVETEKNTVIEFVSNWDNRIVNYLLDDMRYYKDVYNQESVAMYVNKALLLI